MFEERWRFPRSNHGERKGISTGDSEAFRKSPYSAFAREMVQNSVDARESDEEPTQVVIHEFTMNTAEIPGYEGIKAQAKRCLDFWQGKDDYKKAYSKILAYLNEKTISCLRVSDYNTTGLIGVNSSQNSGNKFLALTKSSGVSEKSSAVAGGSKGLGKNAAFLMSGINTIFYSTHADADLNGVLGDFFGSLGVAEFVSGYVDDQHTDDDYTQGTGYFSSNESNEALPHDINMDGAEEERKSKCGTDLYILGFKEEVGWEKEVLNSILDSFMVAIYRNELSVVINDITIDRNHLRSIVYNDTLIAEKQKANIISQFRLVKGGEDVKTYDIETEYGSCDLFLLPLKKEEDSLATHSCAMIRHPLMKIKDEKLGSNYRISAMCIIGKGTIGKMLRDIENPQHLDWEPKRIEDVPSRKEYSSLLKTIKEQIKDKVIECLQTGNENPLDPNGAGEFLPDVSQGESDSSSDGTQKPQEKVEVTPPKPNVAFEKNANQKSDNGNGLEPDIGSTQESEENDATFPEGENGGDGGEPRPGTGTGTVDPGDSIVLRRSKLKGVRYKVISTDKDEGKMRIVFDAPIDYENCYLSISKLDDSNVGTTVLIKSIVYNGKTITSSDSKEYGPFSIKANDKIVLDVTTDERGYFGSEVKIICK